jgi:hypothetical protein
LTLQGIRTGKVPFELWSGGQTFWQHLEANPRHAATFDAAMHEVNQFGGTAVAINYPWSRFDCVVDVAGGVGGFLADILRSNAKLQGVLFDQPAQIGRAEAVSNGYAVSTVVHSLSCACHVTASVSGVLPGSLIWVLQLLTPSVLLLLLQLWQTTHSSLAPRARLVAGDMFDASSIPAPPSSGRVAYVLRNILHDW